MPNNRRIALIAMGAVGSILLLLTLYFLQAKVPLAEVVLYNLYVPENNIIFAPVINGLDFYKIFYLIYLCALTVLFLSKFLGAFQVYRKNLAFIFVFPFMLLFAFLCCCQLVSLHVFHITKFFQYCNRSKEFKNAQIFVDNTQDQQLPFQTSYDDYRFLLECKKRLTPEHTPELLTDYDLNFDPGMYIHRFLSYHLYPVDLRHIKGKQPNCYILFHKNNALDHIPGGFVPLYVHGPSHLIAVRGE